MPRKPAHEQFDTLKAIQDRAFDLFGRYGYEGVSVGDIAKAARLSKGALYWHFHGKGELYLDCLKRLHAIFNAYIFDAIRAEQDGVKGILALFQGLMQLVQDPRVVNGIGGYWLIPSRPETASLVTAQHAFEAASVATLSAVLKRAQAQGHIDLGKEHDQMARAIISLVESVVLPLRKMSPEEVRGIVGILFRAYAKGANVDAMTKLI
jgi:TetR/AcrR family acrAB operon transcriptional repressor